MGYSIRRWLSSDSILFDDSATAKTAEDAIRQAERLSGIFRAVITKDVKKRLIELEPGEVLKIRKPSIKFSMRIRRTKR